MKIPKFKQENWTPFKERFIKFCELTVGPRGIPLYFILFKENRNDNRRTDAPTNIDITPEYIKKSATHYRDHFKNNDEIIFDLLDK